MLNLEAKDSVLDKHSMFDMRTAEEAKHLRPLIAEESCLQSFSWAQFQNILKKRILLTTRPLRENLDPRYTLKTRVISSHPNCNIFVPKLESTPKRDFRWVWTFFSRIYGEDQN